jgi:hypothetical protein
MVIPKEMTCFLMIMPDFGMTLFACVMTPGEKYTGGDAIDVQLYLYTT